MVVGYVTHKPAYLLAFVNAADGILLIGYWLTNQLRIQQHSLEGREIIVLILELLVAVFSLYTIFYYPVSNPFEILQYIIFATNLIVLIAAFIFVLTFKIAKLF